MLSTQNYKTHSIGLDLMSAKTFQIIQLSDQIANKSIRIYHGIQTK